MAQYNDSSLQSIVCSACRQAFSQSEFERSVGMCRCKRDIFDITFLVRTHYQYVREQDDSDDITGKILRVSNEWYDVVAALNDVASRKFEEATDYKEHTVANVAGSVALMLSKATGKEILQFLDHVRREQAEANLQLGEALCKECGKVFKVQRLGPKAIGYCSRPCQTTFEEKSAANTIAAAESARKGVVVMCPQCGKSTKIRPAKKNVCMWCSAPID